MSLAGGKINSLNSISLPLMDQTSFARERCSDTILGLRAENLRATA